MGVEVLVAAIIIVGLGVAAFKIWMKKQIMIRAGQFTSEIYAVWAAQGPFENGETSASAMRYAHAAVRGLESLQETGLAEALSKHALAYDEDPQRWESLRKRSLSGASGQKFEDQLTMAKGFAATDTLNSEMFKDAGYEIGFGRDANGNLTVVSKDLLAEEERQKNRKESGEAIVNAVGNNLLGDESEEAKQLVDFLIGVYRADSGRDPETPGELGHMWIILLNHSSENPEEEVSREFRVLNERWQATMPNAE